MLLGDLGQQLDLDEHRAQMDALRRKIASVGALDDAELHRLRLEINELKLYMATVLRVLVSKKIISQDELRKLIAVVDAEDGTTHDGYHGDISEAGRA